MMKKLLLIFLLIPLWFYGQNIENQSAEQRDSLALSFPLDFNAAYYGNNVWYPGLKIGAEYIWYSKTHAGQVTKEKGSVNKLKTNQWLVGGNLGFFWHPHNYTLLYTGYGLLFRHTNTKKFYWNAGGSPLGLGVTFYNETFEVTDESNVQEVSQATRWYYTPDLVFGIGHFPKKEGTFINGWFLNLRIQGLVRYNAGIMPLTSIEFGFKFNRKKLRK